jgi:hypothetical protein
MPFFEVIVKYGHMGCKKYFEIARYVESDDALSAADAVSESHGLKRKRRYGHLVQCKEVSQMEYDNGRIKEKETITAFLFRNQRQNRNKAHLLREEDITAMFGEYLTQE